MPPEDRRYTSEHEWVRPEGDGLFTVGITDFASGALGDVVYVDLPSLGGKLDAGAVVGEVESTKSVSEIYAPIDGQIVERNDALEAQPDLVNTDPFGEGWIVKIQAADPASYDELMDAASYEQLIAANS